MQDAMPKDQFSVNVHFIALSSSNSRRETRLRVSSTAPSGNLFHIQMYNELRIRKTSLSF